MSFNNCGSCLNTLELTLLLHIIAMKYAIEFATVLGYMLGYMYVGYDKLDVLPFSYKGTVYLLMELNATVFGTKTL